MASNFGSRLLPVVVDETAKAQPDLPYAYVPTSNSVSDGFKAVTFSDIATAANYMATWIHHNLGPSDSFETISYMGLGDLRYVVVFLAAVKCGYKVSVRRKLTGICTDPGHRSCFLHQGIPLG